jgi:hypothetical protein
VQKICIDCFVLQVPIFLIFSPTLFSCGRAGRSRQQRRFAAEHFCVNTPVRVDSVWKLIIVLSGSTLNFLCLLNDTLYLDSGEVDHSRHHQFDSDDDLMQLLQSGRSRTRYCSVGDVQQILDLISIVPVFMHLC